MMKTLDIKASLDNLMAVMAFVEGELEAADCPMKAQMQLTIAVEEIFVNIARYAYEGGEGDAAVGVDASEDAIKIVFEDSGVPYNPLEKADPDVTASAAEREIGGLGIFMVKKSMDSMEYQYIDGKNVLTIVKNI